MAASLGIADLLGKDPGSIKKLAQERHCPIPSLYRVMRALASMSLFSEREDKMVDLTPMADYLKTGSMRFIVLMFNPEWSDKVWEFFYSVMTGIKAFDKAHGMPTTKWLEKNPGARNGKNRV